MQKVTTAVSFPADTPFYQQAEGGEVLFWLLKGEVILTRDGQPVEQIPPRALFGQLPMLSLSLAGLDAIARTPVELRYCHSEAVEELMLQEPQALLKILRWRAARPATLTPPTVEDPLQPSQLIAYKLLRLREMFGRTLTNFSPQDLANACMLTLEETTQGLKTLRDQRAIVMQTGKIILTDLEELAATAHPLVTQNLGSPVRVL